MPQKSETSDPNLLRIYKIGKDNFHIKPAPSLMKM